MKEKNRKISWSIVGVIIAPQVLTQNQNFIFLLAVIIIQLISDKFKIKLDFPGIKIYWCFLTLGLLIGGIYVFLDKYSIYSYFKHFYYFLLPLLYWIIGRNIVRKLNYNRNIILQSLLLSFFLYSVFDIIQVSQTLINTGFNNLETFRQSIGLGTVLPVLGFYLLIFYKKELNNKTVYLYLCYILFLTSILIHFSRTFFIVLVILILFSGSVRSCSKIIKSLIIVCGGILIIYCIFPEFFQNFIIKLLNSNNELQFWSRIWNEISITQNWRGYEMYCEVIKFQNAGIIEKIFGGGFGSSLDVFGYARLVSEESTLAVLHNGYFMQLMIWGITGVILYFGWLFKLYKYSASVLLYQDQRLLKGLTVVLMFITYVVNGPFFGAGVAGYMFYFAVLGKKDIKYKSDFAIKLGVRGNMDGMEA